jgi:hypothetical protein
MSRRATCRVRSTSEQLRIGVNLGDIFGDAANVAARIEGCTPSIVD